MANYGEKARIYHLRHISSVSFTSSAACYKNKLNESVKMILMDLKNVTPIDTYFET